MLVNKISYNPYIYFKSNRSEKNNNPNNAILMLRDPNASVKFEKSQELAQKADAVNSNPFVALGYKLYRTFSLIRDKETYSDANLDYVNILNKI